MMPDVPPASAALMRLGIPHEVFRHKGQVRSLEQAAAERGQRAEQVVRSIVFRLGASQFMMVLMAGPEQIPWKALRKYVGKSRLTLASEAEVLEATGYRIGTVSPFGLARPMRIVIDQSVTGEESISIGSGVPNTGIVMTSKDVLRALREADLVNLSNST